MDREPWTVNHGPWTVNRGPWTVNRRPWTVLILAEDPLNLRAVGRFYQREHQQDARLERCMILRGDGKQTPSLLCGTRLAPRRGGSTLRCNAAGPSARAE